MIARFFPGFTALVLLLLPYSLRAENISSAPIQLLCEQRQDPLGIDLSHPRLGWLLQVPDFSTRGVWQLAYQILAASSPELLAKDQGDLWDSGLVQSGQTSNVIYAGKEPASSQQIFWKVRVTMARQPARSGASGTGELSPWSQQATWTMGLLSPGDWKAKWIQAEGSDEAVPAPKTMGYHAGETKKEDEVKWVQIDLEKPQPIESVHLVPMVHGGKNGFGFPVRFKVEVSDQPDFKTSTVITDETQGDFPNPGTETAAFPGKGISARYVRVTATKLWPRGNGDYCFALRQVAVISKEKNIAKDAPTQSLDSVENFGWGRAGLTDGVLSSSPGAKVQSLLLRRDFTVKPGLRRAVAHVTGLGQYEMFLNGNKIGDDLLAPGWTNYRKTILYSTHDLTSLLKEGSHAIGLLLGNGMYDVEKSPGRYNKFSISLGPQKAIAQIRLEYKDGTVEWVVTDGSWKVQSGPLTYSNVYGGEDYDARLEPKDWNRPGFNATSWQEAKVTQGPGGELKGLSVANPPIHGFEIFKPVATHELRKGVTVYDMGQNASVMPRMAVNGPAGSTVRIVPGELLYPDKSVNQSSGGGPSYWQYTLNGTGHETYFPKFFYRGSRYQQVELMPAPGSDVLPTVESIETVMVHDDSPITGTFTSSNELFNRIWHLVRWAQRSNMASVLTDCPHREKLGWLEEDYLNGPSLRYNFNLGTLFSKAMNDMADSQLENGFVPNIAPEYVKFGGDGDGNPFRNSPEWGCAYLFVAWQQYIFNGDTEPMRVHYEGMKRYMDYLGGKARGNILDFGLGDWFDIGPGRPGEAQLTPKALTATAIYFEEATAMARIAGLLGKDADAKKYEALAGNIRIAFNAKFFKPDTGTYSTNSQTANAMPLVVGLAEPKDRKTIMEAIVKDVQGRGNALTAGDVGYRYLLRALADGGRSDVIYAMNNQSEKPGYGFQLKRGATSLTEAWDANPEPSQNHFMLGQINEWFFHDLAGIQPDPAAPGFRKIVIKPALVGDLNEVKASYDSVAGKIVSEWKKTGTQAELKIVIPPNTSATVYLPTASASSVQEGGKPLGQAQGTQWLKGEEGQTVIEISSGSYSFTFPTP